MHAKEKTQGLVENGNNYRIDNANDLSFSAPTDWTISFMYNFNANGGNIKMTSRVVHYTEEDEKNINSKW